MTTARCLALSMAACTSAGVYSDPPVRDRVPLDAPSGVAANCALPEGPVQTLTSPSDLEQLAVGQWVRCSGVPILADGADDLGIEVDADHHYYRLASDGAGGVVKQTGFSNQGTWRAWTVFQPGGEVQVWGLIDSANAEITTVPVFEDSPRRFAISFDSVNLSIYAIAE